MDLYQDTFYSEEEIIIIFKNPYSFFYDLVVGILMVSFEFYLFI